MLETYTLRISYPKLEDRNDVCGEDADEHAMMMTKAFTLESSNDVSKRSIKVSDAFNDEEHYSRTLRKIIKSLLCFTQSLQELPSKIKKVPTF